MPTFAYVSLQGDDRILRFTQDPATGTLTPLPDIALSGGPAAIAVEPGQRFAFVARRGERRLSSFRIDPLSGDFTLIGPEIAAVHDGKVRLDPDKLDPELLAAARTAHDHETD